MNARRLAYCHPCGVDTPQAFLRLEHASREVVHWQCGVCHTTFMSYADIGDARGFARVMVERWLDGSGAQACDDDYRFDHEELVSIAEAALWRCYLAWNPNAGVRFRAYASAQVPNRLTDWLRKDRGRSVNWRTGEPGNLKPHADSVSLDAPIHDERHDSLVDRLDEALTERRGDPSEGRAAALLGVLARRDKQVVRAELRLGLRAAR